MSVDIFNRVEDKYKKIYTLGGAKMFNFKQKDDTLPRYAEYNGNNDHNWSSIPIGLASEDNTVKRLNLKIIDYSLNAEDSECINLKTRSVMLAGHPGTGKAMLESSLIAHTSKFNNHFQVVGVDILGVEYSLLKGVSSIHGVCGSLQETLYASSVYYNLASQRLKFLEESEHNNIYDIQDKEVNYYEVCGKKYQFDELFTFSVSTKDGFVSYIDTIENIYNMLQDNIFNHVKLPSTFYSDGSIDDNYIDRSSIKKTFGIYRPKQLVLMFEELNEVTGDGRLELVSAIKNNLDYILSINKEVGVTLVLSMQNQQACRYAKEFRDKVDTMILFSYFNSKDSLSAFNADLSNMPNANGHIKGRAFIKNEENKWPIEFQAYYTEYKEYHLNTDLVDAHESVLFKDYQEK